MAPGNGHGDISCRDRCGEAAAATCPVTLEFTWTPEEPEQAVHNFKALLEILWDWDQGERGREIEGSDTPEGKVATSAGRE